MKGNIFRKRWMATVAAAAVIMGGMPVSAWDGEDRQAKAAYAAEHVGNGAVEIVEEGSCGDNVTYTLDGEGALRINGSGDIRHGAFEGRSGLTSVTILEGVTGIGSTAFMNCSGLTSVTIPSSVTNINNMVFWGCSHLTSIDVDERNEQYCSVDGVLFDYGKKTIVICPEGKEGAYQIPEKVTDIADLAFSNCSKLTGVTIPEGVTRIGSYVFSGCSGLTSVMIPEGVTVIRENAFSGCSGLTSVTIPEGVTEIRYSAFEDCSGLTSIDVDKGNKQYCSMNGVLFDYGRKTIFVYPAGKKGAYQIPEGVTSIGDSAFSGCDGLKSVTIPEGVTSIGASAFSGCSSLKSVKIPSHVTNIGDYAFQDCSGLTNVELPSSVTDIGNSAFWGCSGLTSVELPSGVINIEANAFWGCSGLASVTIPEGVTSIGYAVFSGCSELTSINVDEGNARYYSVDGVLFDAEKNELCLYPAGKEGVYQIPSEVTSIGDYAFWGCTGLTSVTIPSSVTSIGDSAFSFQTIYCVENSCAHAYAVENNIPFSFGQPPAKLQTYTITFDANGGTGLSQGSRTVIAGTVIGVIPTAMRTGYTLKGWYTAKVGGNEVTEDDIAVADLTLYAQWDAVLADEDDKQDENPGDKPDNQPDDKETEKLSIEDAEVTLSKTAYSYDGKAKKPMIKSVKLGDAELKSGIDYSAAVSYKNNKNIGKATAIVELAGKGNYTGKASIRMTFTIRAKEGDSFTVGSYKYKVTGSKTVAFSGLKSAKTKMVKIPKTVEIGKKIFKVTSIADKALKNAKVTSVTVSENITEIGSGAFRDCKKLAVITVKSMKLKAVGKNAFKGIKSDAKIKVPAKKLSVYKKLLKGKGMGRGVKITK